MTGYDLATRLALVKYIADTVKAEDARLREALAAEMHPGDRRHAALSPAADSIATISRAEVRQTTTLAVTDPAALLEWAEANGHADAVITTRALAEWFTAAANLEALVSTTGEIPDGVEVVEKRTGGYLRIGQTEKQRDTLRGQIASGLLDGLVVELAQIEGEQPE